MQALWTDLSSCDFLLCCAATCSTDWVLPKGGVMPVLMVLGDGAIPLLQRGAKVEGKSSRTVSGVRVHWREQEGLGL